MTSKERVLTTIAHKEPDRVPVGEWGIDHDHISRVIGKHTFWRNRKDTTLALWEGRRDEVVESLKEDCVKFVDALDYDIVTVELVPPKGEKPAEVPKQIAEGVWQDSKGTTYKYAASNDSIQDVTKREGLEEISEQMLEDAMYKATHIDESQFELIDYICDHYGDQKAILCRSMDIYDHLMSPFGGGYEHQLMMTMIAPEEIEKLYDSCFAYNQTVIDHCRKKGVSIFMQGQDFGMNTGCIMSPDTIRELYFPVAREVNRRTAEAGMIPFFHCCGNIWAIMDDYVAAGYKGYQSIQESAGMDNARMKKEYGDKLTMWTGIQCETLINGSLSDVDKEVNRNLELLMPGGGFMFASTNSVQFGAKTENYLRALEIVREKGIY